MHVDGLKDDLLLISVSTSALICSFRASPSFGLLAFCISILRSSFDASFVDVGMLPLGDITALFETILLFLCVDGWMTKQQTDLG